MDSGTEGQSNFFWVGIGASAGGLEPIQRLCQSLPKNANMVYIVAQHLSPKHKSMLSELVQRNVDLRVEILSDDVLPTPNTIYITPPQMDVYVMDGKIRLKKASTETIPKPSVNELFISLAEEQKEHSVGIILSGTGSDGALGVKAIRAAGGLTIAQNEETAKYSGMPQAAIDTDCVDFVLSPNDIGRKLIDISTQLTNRQKLRLEKAEIKDSFAELLGLVHKQCGVTFKQYKKGTLQRRIERRMLACGVEDFEEYVALARENSQEVELLYRDVLISVTSFFRDFPHFEALQNIIAGIMDRKEKQSTIRMWSVGCATGEEPYSLAMLVAEALGGVDKLIESNIQIFATDLDTQALNFARRGVYQEAMMASVPEDYLRKYFIKRGDTYEVIKPLKEVVLFAKHNVIEDPPFLRMNLITCRNLLIYFEPELQNRVYGLFHYSLGVGGHLFLGKSESVTHVNELFRSVDAKKKIFQKRAGVLPQGNRHFIKNAGPKISKVEIKPEKEQDHTPQIHESLIRQLGDASVLVDENLNIERVYGDATPYITIANIKPNWNIAEMVNDAHKQEMRALAFKSLRTGTSIAGQPRKIKIDGKVLLSRVKIYPIEAQGNSERFLLVCFERVGSVRKKTHDGVKDQASSERLKELEDELTAAREHLQTVIEELETTNEELQSMNEELQSSNEELQSSNEELETTNEEMQSTNEELVTMNDELNSKTVALEQTTVQILNIINSLDYPLILINEGCRIVKANDIAHDFFAQNVDGKNIKKIFPEVLQEYDLMSTVNEVFEDGSARSVQIKKGNSYYMLHMSAFRDQRNKVTGAVLNFIDNTEIMEQKEELMESQEKAQMANIAKSDFLANISHEIRTPLNAIYGVTELLRDNVDHKETLEKLLSILEDGSHNLKSLLDDLLDFAKLEAKQVRLEYTNFSIRDLVDKIVNVYSIKASENDVTIKTNIYGSVPHVLMGDPLRLNQILANLLSNAIKFTHSGEVVLSVDGRKVEENFKLELIVKDSGIGMSREELGHIFEKFSQTDTSISRKYGGTGLGLSIVKELVSLMNGEVEVESTKGKGTTFKVSLLLKVASDKTQLKKAQNLVHEKIFSDQKEARRYPVLIVEDNEPNSYVLTNFLDKLGCVYQTAMSGSEGLELIEKQQFAVILLDIQLDDMSGFEFYQTLKKMNVDLTKLKVIAVTAHVQDNIIKQCEAAGMDGFISKPLELSKLRTVLVKALEL